MALAPVECTLGDLASLVGGRAVGDGDLSLTGVATLSEAGPHELGLVAEREFLPAVPESRAGALLVSEELAPDMLGAPNRLVVHDPREALARLIGHFHPEPHSRPRIHRTAVIGRGVELGEGVSVGPYVVLEGGAVVGDRATLHAHVVVREGARIGADSVLHPHVVLYPGVEVGDRVVLHAGARIGVDGFGFALSEGEPKKIPHVGWCVIGDDVEIGANSCVDRGSIGRTKLGRRTKLDNLVHIAHNVTVGPGTLMAGMVGIAGSTKIGAGTMWGGQSGAADHVEIGDRVRVAAQAGIIEDVPSGETVAGFPARPLAHFLRASASLYRLADLRRRVRTMERALGLGVGEGDPK